MTLFDTLQLLIRYQYLILFPLAVIEGPIITVIAGFLVTLGLMNPVIVYIIVMVGDIIGDSGVYALGRWGGNFFFKKIGPRIGVTDARVAKAKEYFESRGNKALLLSKYVHGIGMAGLVAAGSLKISYTRYVTVCFLATLVQVAVFLVIGVLFGHLYAQIAQYLNYIAALASIIVLFVLGLFILKRKGLLPTIGR